VKKIVFANRKFQHRLHHTLTASLNMDGDLVFDDGEFYSGVNGSDSREVDDCLMVRAEHKSRVLNLLAQAFNGISDTCGEVEDERLFCTLERLARSGHWKMLDEIENWLMDRDIPFTKQRVVIK
jgi:hypothetical protein